MIPDPPLVKAVQNSKYDDCKMPAEPVNLQN